MGVMMGVAMVFHFCGFVFHVIVTLAHGEENSYTYQEENNYCDEDP